MNRKLYNVFFPIWFLLLFPSSWLVVLPVNFIIDTVVLLLALVIFKIASKKEIYLKTILKMWIVGFVADIVGSVIMLTTQIFPTIGILDEIAQSITWNPFRNVWGFCYTALAVLFTGGIIFELTRRITLKKTSLTDVQKKKLAIVIAVFTAPYFFFYPSEYVYLNKDANISEYVQVEVKDENTNLSRILAESLNYIESDFDFPGKISNMSTEILEDGKIISVTLFSNGILEPQELDEVEKIAKKASVIYFTENVNTAKFCLGVKSDPVNLLCDLNVEVNKEQVKDELQVDFAKIQNSHEDLQALMNRMK